MIYSDNRNIYYLNRDDNLYLLCILISIQIDKLVLFHLAYALALSSEAIFNSCMLTEGSD